MAASMVRERAPTPRPAPCPCMSTLPPMPLCSPWIAAIPAFSISPNRTGKSRRRRRASSLAGAPTFAYRIDDECGDAPGGREREDATDDDCPARVLPEAPERVRQVDHDSHRRPERLGIAVPARLRPLC